MQKMANHIAKGKTNEE